MKTLIINIDQDSSLKLLMDLVNKLHLKVKVVSTEKTEEENEREGWNNFSMKNLNAAYGDNEPDYDLSMVKEPNPEYKP